MTTQYPVILKSLNYHVIAKSEQRTAMHHSEFTGHEKHYIVNILNIDFEIIWRKGVDNIYRRTEGEQHFETSERIESIEILHEEELLEVDCSESALVGFLKALEAHGRGLMVLLPLPPVLLRLLHEIESSTKGNRKLI